MQLHINIPSYQNVDVKLHLWRISEVQHLDKMPTSSALSCENITGSGVEFYRIPAQLFLVYTLKKHVLPKVSW